MPPINDQGKQSSCVAWAIGYGLATYEINKATVGSGSSAASQVSPADVYALTIAAMNQAGRAASCTGQGTDPRFALDELNRDGSQSMESAPYSDQGCMNPTVGPLMIRGWHTIAPTDRETIKTMLSQGHPVAILLAVPSDFIQFLSGPNKAGVYQGRAPLLQAGHAMLAVGYDDSRQAWKVMNSYGTSRGDRGFLWLSYDAFDRIGSAAYVADGGAQDYNPPPPGGNVTFSAISALEYLDYQHLVAYLVMPFTLSEPIYVQQWRLIYEENGHATPWQQVNQYAYNNYVWWGLYNQTYPPGRYSLEFTGYNRVGTPVDVKGTAVLAQSGALVHASDRILAPLINPGSRAAGMFTEATFGRGLRLMANGRLTEIK